MYVHGLPHPPCTGVDYVLRLPIPPSIEVDFEQGLPTHVHTGRQCTNTT